MLKERADDLVVTSAEADHLRDLFDQWQAAHAELHLAEERARMIVLDEINRRLSEMNDQHTQINHERGLFVQRDWFDKTHDTLRREMIDRTDLGTKTREVLRDEMYRIKDGTDHALKAIETTLANFEGRIWMLGAFMSVLVVGLNLLLKYWR
jgi:hypothetical protein